MSNIYNQGSLFVDLQLVRGHSGRGGPLVAGGITKLVSIRRSKVIKDSRATGTYGSVSC